MAVHYEFREESGVTVASVTGQLNLGNRLMEFEHAVKQRIDAGSRKMVLDLSGLTYIYSAGLGMMAACVGAMSSAGGKLVLVTLAGKVTQMFEITRLNRIIELFPTVDAACRFFPAPPETAAK